MNLKKKIYLRDLNLNDLDLFLELNHPSKKHHQFNAPYFKKRNEGEWADYVEALRHKLINRQKNVLEQKRIISFKDNDQLLGTVNWYWRSEETNWMEIGIVIFEEKFWGQNIGYRALKIWTNEIFYKFPQLVRLGLTTWSGNLAMIGLAEKLGYKREALYRKARLINGKYYDSISYGILKDEWLEPLLKRQDTYD